jgi:MYXO-CTERM domain-containing protein
MMFLFAAWASAADCDPAAALATLPSRGSKEDYLCVSKAETGKDLLVTEMLKDPAADHARLTRALVLWLLERTDRPMDPAVVARLSPADRRLLADGIRARRGRASPAPEHAAVFANLTWYEPIPGYNDARLRPIDRENLLVVDPPVHPAAPDPSDEGADEGVGEIAPVILPKTAKTAEAPKMCGCAGVEGGGAGLGLLGGLALLTRRRRRG